MPYAVPFRSLIRAAALAAASLALDASGTHLKLFVLTGQSNSLGTTAGGEADPSPGSDPADARIRFFWHNVADAATSLGDSGGTFTNLCAQQGGYYSGSATHWGPEISFGRTLYRAGLRDFALVKASRGGGGNTLWSKADNGHMYTLVTGTVAQAAAALSGAGHTFEIAGLLYLQGESDSTAEAAVASNRLAALVANLRADLPNAAALRCVAGGIAASGTARDVVRAQQSALAAADPLIDAFRTLDLQGQLYDGLHFDKAAKLTVGQRFAQAFLDASTVTPRYGRLAFVGDSITQGGNSHPSYRYELFKRLATNRADVTFVGSVTGAYAWSSVSTPSWAGRAFTNAHDGHWGWRAAWTSGRVPLPAGRYNASNLGCGTLSNWTGRAASYATADAGALAYSGATYTPDTAVVLIGINDLGDGTSTNQLLADTATLVRALQAANPNVTVHVASLTRVGSGHAQYPALNATIDAYNAQLARFAPAWSTTGSAVFYADVTSGYTADTLTYDNVHPNAAGETFMAERLSAALGLASTQEPADLPKKDSAAFAYRFVGSALWNGAAWANGWSEGGAGTESLENVDDVRFKASGTGEALSGEGEDGAGGLTWSDGYGNDWTLEVRLKVNAAANGVALWAGEGENKPLTAVAIYNDRTTSTAGRFTDTSANNDGRYHTFRVAYQAALDRYHVWRDGVRLTPAEGAAADLASNANAEWFFIGDYTSATFGDDFDITVDTVRYDLTGAYAPTPHVYALPFTLSGYVGTSVLTNFPALVALGPDIPGFSAATFTSTQGFDLRFWNETRTQPLDYEIDTWSPSGTSLVWVRVPALTGTGTRLYATWGDAFADTPPPCTTNGAVWSNTFHTVLHLSGTNAAGLFADATATAKPFVNSGATNIASGVIGRAQGFAASAYARSQATNLLATPYTAACFSGWYRAAPGGGWLYSHQGAHALVENAGSPRPFFDGSLAGSTGYGTNLNDGAWHHFAVQNSAGLTEVYLDGALRGTQAETLFTNRLGRATSLAANYDQSNPFSGALDEFRIALAALPPDWHLAAFSNALDAAAFARAGELLPLEPPSLSDVFAGGDGHYAVYRIQALQATLGGALLAFAEGRASISDQAQNDIVLKRSFDGGATWGTLQLLHDDGTNSLNNPCVVQDALTGRIHLMYQRYPYGLNEGSVTAGYTGNTICRGYVMTSDDDGATWSAPLDITPQVKPPAPADSIASGPGIGIQLRHPGPDGVPRTADDRAGRLIMPFNHGEPGSVWRVYAAYSDDHGATWAFGADAPDSLAGDGNEVQMVELSDGRVLLNARAQGGSKYRIVATSADGGQTWSPLAYDYHLIEPTCCASVLRLSDPLDGQANRILYAGPFSQSSRVNGNIHLSLDDGATWPVRRELYAGSYGYSTLSALADGRIGCLFERDGYDKISFASAPLSWLTSGAEAFEGGYPRITVYDGAAGITFTSATLRATLTTTGTAETAVSVYWGASDGGTNALAWEHGAELGVQRTALPAACAAEVTGLASNTPYCYRYRASNARGAAWSEKGLFRTQDSLPLSATNSAGATDLLAGGALLNGAANKACGLLLAFGPSDGVTNLAAWAAAYALSYAGTGSASHAVTGLLYGIRYFYRTAATNEVETSWADSSVAFATPRAPLTSSVEGTNNYGTYAGQSLLFADPLATVAKSPAAAAMPQDIALTAFSFWRRTGDAGTFGPLYLNLYRGASWTNDFVGSSTNTVDFRALAEGQKGTWRFDALRLDKATEYYVMASTAPRPGNPATLRLYVQSGNPSSGALKDASGATLSAGYDARYEAVAELPARLASSGATEVQPRAATLHGTLTGVAAVYQALACWSPEDGGTNWEHVAAAGCYTNALGQPLAWRAEGLQPDRSYRFAWLATNAFHRLWSPALRFETCSGTRLLVN